MEKAEEGALAPDFDLPADGGRRVRLADSRGKKVVLYFYPQDDTETCTVEAIDFSARAKDFARAGVIVIGISPDTPKSHDRFKAKHELNLTLASDVERKVVERYGLWVEKNDVRPHLYGRRAGHVSDRAGWQDCPRLAQGARQGTHRAGAPGGQGIVKTRMRKEAQRQGIINLNRL